MKVDANPTKEFFISMLTRDISLDRAILDLIDNSVDASLSFADLNGLEIEILIGPNQFSIEDNCGGMTSEIASKYAFRFGRDPDERLTPNSVGQFGVGMKRTLFKLGARFSVISHSVDSGKPDSFKLSVDVPAWLGQKNRDWAFDLEKIDPSGTAGTKIEVEELYSPVSEQFGSNEFVVGLAEEIAQAHFKAINRGLAIKVNGKSVGRFSIEVKESEELKSIVLNDIYDGVKISVKAGVGEQNYHEGGWYIVCNGRLVETADKTKTTLWDSGSIPQYHDRFAYFRGVVDFESEDSSKLPWTTTKTGVDVDNSIYRYANKFMIDAMKPILAYLNQIVREKKNVQEGRQITFPLQSAIQKAQLLNIYEIQPRKDFVRPNPGDAQEATHATISYQMELNKIIAVKEALGVEANADVGRKTFEYYYNYECKK